MAEVKDPTGFYGWDLPAVAGSDGTWGTELNELYADVAGAIESIDEVLTTLQAALTTLEAGVVTSDTLIEALKAQNKKAYVHAISTKIPVVTKNTPAILEWTSAPTDEGPLFDILKPTRLTVPVELDGLWEVRAVVEVELYAQSGDNSRRWEVRLLRNGAEIASTQVPYHNDGADPINSPTQIIMVESLIQGDVGEYFEVEVIWNEFEEAATTAKVNLSAQPFKTFFEASRYPSPVISAVWEPWTNYIPVTMWGGTRYGGTMPSTFGFTSGNAHYVPFIPSEDMTIDKMAIRVDLQDALDTGTARLGIYAVKSATDHRPGALLAETADIATGEIDATFETAFGTAVVLTKGTLYWFAMIWKVGVGGALDVYGTGDARFNPSIGQGGFATGNDTGDMGMRAVIGVGWSTMPDPADLTSEVFDSNLVTMLAHRSA